VTTVAQFDVTFTQYIDEAGNLIKKLPRALEDPETLKELYRVMVLIRTFDKKAIALQRTGKMGTYAPINGQEAISTAIGHAMRQDDVFIPYYRDYAAQFQRGVKLSEILTYWGGDERGSNFANQSEDLPICVPIASQCLHATGIAFAFQYRKEDRVALVCIGDGGTSEGDFYEAINLAGAWNLPVVFVINNNQWAISVPRSQQTSTETLAQKAIAAGFKGLQVDGNDVLATRIVIGEALEKARKGEGPTLIEALSYRLCDHTTADDASRYQPGTEVDDARHKEPIARLKHYMTEHGIWRSSDEEQWVIECTNQVEKSVEEYLNTKPQPVTSIFDYHYAELPEYLALQRATAIEEALHA
jgi:2-oxoisovalerate dehydrogenase E1 component alpha subunit